MPITAHHGKTHTHLLLRHHNTAAICVRGCVATDTANSDRPDACAARLSLTVNAAIDLSFLLLYVHSSHTQLIRDGDGGGGGGSCTCIHSAACLSLTMNAASDLSFMLLNVHR